MGSLANSLVILNYRGRESGGFTAQTLGNDSSFCSISDLLSRAKIGNIMPFRMACMPPGYAVPN